jgi:hypothetical protein
LKLRQLVGQARRSRIWTGRILAHHSAAGAVRSSATFEADSCTAHIAAVDKPDDAAQGLR